jgi:endonuclease/exonuclease/phosphatase family metal-dependent hydrolase
MRLICWNIQWGRGVDGKVDLPRIVREARGIADFDVLCLQELTRGFHAQQKIGGGAGLPGSPSADQFAELAALLPGFAVFSAIGADLPPVQIGGLRRQFGNAIATRLPPRQVFRHSLPWPADPGIPSMPRMALEAVIDTDAGPLRIITTHLEFYSETQRMAQIETLRDLHVEACGHAARPAAQEGRESPFAAMPRPASAVVCGDFNSAAGASAYRRMLAPMPAGAAAPDFLDAWILANPGLARAPTVGVYDHEQWRDGPFPCDFIFVTSDLAGRVARCQVDQQSAASDHQPVLLELH